MHYAKKDMKEKGVNDIVVVGSGKWKKKTCCADLKEHGTWVER